MGDEQEGRKHVLRQFPGNRENRWKPCIIPVEKTGLGHRKAATEFREITGRAGQTMHAAADLKILKQHSDGALAAVGIVTISLRTVITFSYRPTQDGVGGPVHSVPGRLESGPAMGVNVAVAGVVVGCRSGRRRGPLA